MPAATFTLTATFQHHDGSPIVGAPVDILGVSVPDGVADVLYIGRTTVATDANGHISVALLASTGVWYKVQPGNLKSRLRDPITGDALNVIVPSQTAGSTHDLTEFTSTAIPAITPSAVLDALNAATAAAASASAAAASAAAAAAVGTTNDTVIASRVNDAATPSATRSALDGLYVKRENTKARYGSPPIDSRADVDRFIAPNAAAKLSINTGIGDPNNEVVEPSVWYDPNGLFGYEYWMAAGPYQNSNSAVENPSVWCSHDGLTWIVPPGGSNPIVPMPGSGNYDDPHLYELGGTLYLVWNWNTATNDQVLMRSTRDGITWSSTVSLRTGTSGTNGEFVSPHIEYQDGLWYMWTLNRQGTRTIYLSTCTTLTGTWSAPTACVTPLPSGRDHWEFEIRRVGSEWWMLQCVVVPGGTASGGQLRFRTSKDGINWNMSARPVLAGSATSGSFDENFIYKPSFVPLHDGRMAIWYSAGSGGTLRWSIGYTIAGLPRAVGVTTGNWYAPTTGVGTAPLSNGFAFFLPYYFDKATSIQTLALEVTTAGSAGSVPRLGIYDDNGRGRPGSLIVDAGAIDGTTTGVKTATISQQVGPGVVWFAAIGLGAPTTAPTVRVCNTPSNVPIGAFTSTLASQNALVGHRQSSLSAFPTNATIDPSSVSGNIPRVIFQAT